MHQDDDLEDVPTRVHSGGAEPAGAAVKFNPKKTAIGLGLPQVDPSLYPPLDWDDDHAPTRVRSSVDDELDKTVVEKVAPREASTAAPAEPVAASPEPVAASPEPVAAPSEPDDDDAQTQVAVRAARPLPSLMDDAAPFDPMAVTAPMMLAPFGQPQQQAPAPPQYPFEAYPLFESAPPITRPVVEADDDPRRGRAWAVLAVAVLVSMAAAGLVAFLLFRPDRGRLTVDLAVEGNKPVQQVEVFVDGRLACAQIPCVVDDLATGGRIVRVVAAGFVTPEAVTETVTPGRDTSVRVPIHTVASRTGLRVAGNQPGVKVFVDGKDHGPLPARVVDLAPGSHRLRFAGSDRYAPVEQTVEVTPGKVTDLGDVKLPVRLGRITVDLVTPDANVVVVRDGLRKLMRGPWPMSVDVDPSEHWKLVAAKPGHETLELPLDFADGQALASVRVDLARKTD